MNARVFPLLAGAVSILFAGCSGGSNGNNTNSTPVTNTNNTPPPPSQFTIGGTVANLVGNGGGLQLQDNGGDTLSVNANGAFTFAKAVVDGSAYAVTISTQPSNPAQNCAVTNGTGKATANVTNVTVDCGRNEWTWTGGSDLADQPASYGFEGVPSTTNIPGARGSVYVWLDKSQNVWLFGGRGPVIVQNDFWKYINGEWAWMGGSQ